MSPMSVTGVLQVYTQQSTTLHMPCSFICSLSDNYLHNF